MERSNSTFIAIVEWNWVGHHPTYFRMFTQVALDCGYHVIAFIPESEGFMDVLRENGVAESLLDRLTVVRSSWRSVPYMPRLTPFFSFLAVDRQLTKLERLGGFRTDLVFFACVYDVPFRYFRSAWRWVRRPWAGLYLHCRSVRCPNTYVPHTRHLPRPDIYLKCPDHRGVAILDEFAVDRMRKVSGRPVVPFPDVADLSVNETVKAELLHAIDDKLAGQPVIGHVGHLQKSKGTTVLARLILEKHFDHCLFILAGSMDRKTFSAAEQDLIDEALNSPNVISQIGKLDESVFNAVLSRCSVLFAAYLDFPNSSNVLTKAAAFRKPIVVSDGYLMADRVREFRLGLCVPEDDVRASADALRELTDRTDQWISSQRPLWTDYCDIHSRERLQEQFSTLIEACLTEQEHS